MRSRLVHRQVASNSPLRSANGLGGLIKLRSHVEVVDGRLPTVDAIENDERVDLKVSEVEVDVDGVEADEEVDEGLFLGGGDVGEESVGDCLTRGEWCANGKAQLEGLRVDIANVDTTLVCEENVVTFTGGVDADVVLGIGRMRQEGLDDEVVERAGHRLDLVQIAISTDPPHTVTAWSKTRYDAVTWTIENAS